MLVTTPPNSTQYVVCHRTESKGGGARMSQKLGPARFGTCQRQGLPEIGVCQKLESPRGLEIRVAEWPLRRRASRGRNLPETGTYQRPGSIRGWSLPDVLRSEWLKGR
ncbi:hypothetical protein J6590_024375 [Homalodisca vitripennis]|nr:hypothetical protein J6590_024375 [Homalodisca vitripennis]